MDMSMKHGGYHSLVMDNLSVSQDTGEIRYTGRPRDPVAQFIGPKPLSEFCCQFSLVIVNRGHGCLICIGLCPRRYRGGRQPGWDNNSIGYHADNGGIYHDAGHCVITPDTADEGDVMGCSLDLSDNTVNFTLNGRTVFTSETQMIPPGGFYPIIGLHSYGEVVRLLEVEPWTPSAEDELNAWHLTYNSLYSRETKVSQATGIVRYFPMSKGTVGQCISKCPLSSSCNSYSVEVASLGTSCGVSVGVCHRCYPSNCYPGHLPCSIAYHVDGKIHYGLHQTPVHGPPIRAGDTVACEVDFSSNTVVFRRNRNEVYRSTQISIPEGGYHAIIGLTSPDEVVCLLEKQPWRSDVVMTSPFEDANKESSNSNAGTDSALEPEETISEPVETDEQQLQISPNASVSSRDVPGAPDPQFAMTRPRCCICMDRGVSQFLVPCGHTFCEECTEEWTLDNKTCPACRVPYQDVNMLYF